MREPAPGTPVATPSFINMQAEPHRAIIASNRPRLRTALPLKYVRPIGIMQTGALWRLNSGSAAMHTLRKLYFHDGFLARTAPATAAAR